MEPSAELTGSSEALRRRLQPMTAREVTYFLVAETDIMARATPRQRQCLQQCHPACESHAPHGPAAEMRS